MTPLQKATLRASEIRSRSSPSLAGVEELTDEQTAEIGTLRTEYQDGRNPLARRSPSPKTSRSLPRAAPKTASGRS